jgi:hypothetical protein
MQSTGISSAETARLEMSNPEILPGDLADQNISNIEALSIGSGSGGRNWGKVGCPTSFEAVARYAEYSPGSTSGKKKS